MKKPARTRQGNNYLLLGGLCLLLLIVPVVSELMGPGLTIELEFPVAGLVILGVWSLYDSKQSLYLGIVLLAVVSLSVATFFVYRWEAARWVTLLSMLIFLVLSSVAVLRHVMFPGPVDLNRIVGAFCVYLMIGVFGAVLYYFLQTVVPGSFAGLESYDERQWFWRLLYFSFVTLSTLGYGDITPANAFSESVAYLQAIIGQFYIAVVIASLVGSYIAEHDNTDVAAEEEDDRDP